VLSRPFQPLSNRMQKVTSHIRATSVEVCNFSSLEPNVVNYLRPSVVVICAKYLNYMVYSELFRSGKVE
jgi:hypothetical protein